MQKDLDINPAFSEWKLSTGPEKEQAFQELIRRLTRYITAICWQRLPDFNNELPALTNGIVWRVTKHLDRYKGERECKFSTWVYYIVRNECNRFLRNQKRQSEMELVEEIPVPSVNTDARIDLIALLDTLRGQDHILFRLVAEGIDFRGIGEVLGITQGAALVRWNRLKKRLRDAL